jgi:ADP-ribosyl-[dinitrogen reductase] hydrolase
MSLCIARALYKSDCWDLSGIASEFAIWLKSKPIDIGDTCRRGIRNFILNGKMETQENEWDAGNGALMRMVPIAIYALEDSRLLEKYSLEQAHLTHNNIISDQSCICYGKLLQHSIVGRSKSTLRREVDELVKYFPVFRFEPYKGLATGYVVDTFQTVCHYFFRSKNFEECLIGVVNQGGDADTTGAIMGGLAGAYYGFESIPKRWINKIEKKITSELEKYSNFGFERMPVLNRLLP